MNEYIMFAAVSAISEIGACQLAALAHKTRKNVNIHISGCCMTITLALALCGCGSIDRRPESVSSGGVASTASADEEPSHETRPSDRKLSLNLHIFGLSYHPDREGTHIRHLDNERNFGLGLGYKLHSDARGQTNVEAGFYKDSGSNWAKFAGVGYQFKFGDHWRLGADLLVIESQTYNYGRAFVAPIPRLTYDFGPAKINATFVPKVQAFNQFDVFFVYFTIPLRK